MKKSIIHTNRTHRMIAKHVEVRNKTNYQLFKLHYCNSTKQFIKTVFIKQDMIFMKFKVKHNFHL